MEQKINTTCRKILSALAGTIRISEMASYKPVGNIARRHQHISQQRGDSSETEGKMLCNRVWSTEGSEMAAGHRLKAKHRSAESMHGAKGRA